MHIAAYSNPYGWPVREITGFAYNRTTAAVAVGDVVALDIGGTDGDVTALDKDAMFGNFVAVTAVAQCAHPLAVVMEAGADNALVKVCLQSPKILVQYGSKAGTTAVGEPLWWDGTGTADALESDAPTTGDVARVVGVALEAADGVKYAVFNGFGMGVVADGAPATA